MRCLAIIPARGGSKRLPRKNCLPFLGKPLFVWSCEAAQQSGCFDHILVSTEDAEIAALARAYGFAVDNRPPELATDQAGTTDICLELLERLARQGDVYDVIALLYPTAPLRNADDIRSMMRLVTREDTDFVHAVTSFEGNPYQVLYQDAKGYLAPAWPLLVQKKSQELPRPFRGNGSTYIAKTNALKQAGTFYGARLRGYQMDRLRSADIDTHEDFDMLTAFASILKERSHAKVDI